MDLFVGTLLWVVMPVLTFGMATPVLCLGAAIRRRSIVHLIAAVASGALVVVMLRSLDEPGMRDIGLTVGFAVLFGATQVLPAARERRSHIEVLKNLHG
jgi:hypothetical protein